MSKRSDCDIPVFNLPLIDTHCHLDYLEKLPIPQIVQKALDNGVTKLITISVANDNLSIVRQLAKEYEFVFCCQGIHPHNAKEWEDNTEREIVNYLSQAKKHKIVAVGEIGLDFHYNHSDAKKQLDVFVRQMDLAGQYNLPVIIHSRQADCETIQVLNDSKLAKKGVIHSFTSGAELAKKALDCGMYIGLNGIITFKNANSVRDIAKMCPLEHILLETDAPFLTPAPFRGRENAPYYLPLVAQKLAEIKQISVDKVIEQTTINAQKLFAI